MKKILLFVFIFVFFAIPVQSVTTDIESEIMLFELNLRTDEKSIVQKYENYSSSNIKGTYELTNFAKGEMDMSITGRIEEKTFKKMADTIQNYNVDKWFRLGNENIDYSKNVFHLKICTNTCQEVISNQIPEDLEMLSKELRDLTLKDGFLGAGKVILFMIIGFSLIIGFTVFRVIMVIKLRYWQYKKRLKEENIDEDSVSE